ncbi:hypothetical protein HK101_010799 [Irineochytrium annulatum]|nr:hypothetical protein HK101_010799 [Irineochytrium annulatum]
MLSAAISMDDLPKQDVTYCMRAGGREEESQDVRRDTLCCSNDLILKLSSSRSKLVEAYQKTIFLAKQLAKFNSALAYDVGVDPVVILCVGDRLFHTSCDVLVSEADSFSPDLLSANFKGRNKGEPFFIPREACVFEHVLSIKIYGEVMVQPTDFKRRSNHGRKRFIK